MFQMSFTNAIFYRRIHYWNLVVLAISLIDAILLGNVSSKSIASDNFRDLVLDDQYVDKSLLIEEFLRKASCKTNCGKAFLITRPKGWGKSTNLDTLRTFLEVTVNSNGEAVSPLSEENVNRKLFVGGKISANGVTKDVKPLIIARHRYSMAHQGLYPVIWISFRNVTGSSCEEIRRKIILLIADLYRRYSYLIDCHMVGENDQARLATYASGENINELFLKDSLRFLTDLLHEHFKRKVYVFVDDYDVPIRSLYVSLSERNEPNYKETSLHPEFRDTQEFFWSFLEGCLPLDAAVSQVLISGSVRVKFTDKANEVDDIVWYGIQEDTVFQDYYGFTEEELRDLSAKSGYLSNDVDPDTIRRWYGYRLNGGKMFYNPWSVKHFLANDGKFAEYWSDRDELYNNTKVSIVDSLACDAQELLQHLIDGGVVEKRLTKFVTYYDIEGETVNYLLFDGYLIPNWYRDNVAELHIPNREMRNILKRKLADC